MVVVKVGGSLYDLADLGARLRAFLASLGDPAWLVVPGGGAAADVVRALDRAHGLGQERAHWLALRACTLNAHFLRELLPGAELIADPSGCRGPSILDAHEVALAHDGRPGCLPHDWDATSDAVAARAAVVAGASLVLLKSAAMPAGAWEEAAAAGLVDPVLPGLLRQLREPVRVVNLRDWPGGEPPGSCRRSGRRA